MTSVSHEELMTFQDKVMSVITSMEARLETLTTHMKMRAQEIGEELAIYKVVVLARVIAFRRH